MVELLKRGEAEAEAHVQVLGLLEVHAVAAHVVRPPAHEHLVAGTLWHALAHALEHELQDGCTHMTKGTGSKSV